MPETAVDTTINISVDVREFVGNDIYSAVKTLITLSNGMTPIACGVCYEESTELIEALAKQIYSEADRLLAKCNAAQSKAGPCSADRQPRFIVCSERIRPQVQSIIAATGENIGCVDSPEAEKPDIEVTWRDGQQYGCVPTSFDTEETIYLCIGEGREPTKFQRTVLDLMAAGA